MSRDLNIITARSYINLMSARAKTELQVEHLDNVYNQLEYLEQWRRTAIKMLNEKEIELRKRAETIQNLSSEVSTLKTELSGLNMALISLEEVNNNLSKQLENKF